MKYEYCKIDTPLLKDTKCIFLLLSRSFKIISWSESYNECTISGVFYKFLTVCPELMKKQVQLLAFKIRACTLPLPRHDTDSRKCPGWDRQLSGFPICKPCLDVRQNPSRDTHFPSYGGRPLPKPKPKAHLWSKDASKDEL